MDPRDLMLTALRATLIYFFLLLVIRLLGKRAVGAVGAFDLVVALMLGEVVDEAIFGDVSMVKGLLAIVVIAVWHFANEWINFKNPKIGEITDGKPSVVVKDGKIQRKALAKERMNEEELWSQLRMQSVDKLDEIKEATLEPSGQVSVLKKEEAKPLQKSDLGPARREAKKASA